MLSCEGTLNPDTSGQFIKFFGGALDETAFAIKQNTAGEFVMVGNSLSFGQNQRIFIAKADQNGNKIWQKTFSNQEVAAQLMSNEPDTLAQSGRDIEILPNGNILVLGNIRSIRPDFANLSLLTLLELSPDGALIDSQIFTTTLLRDSDSFYLNRLSDDGFMMIANTVREQNFTTSDMYLHKLDASKNTVYERIYGLLNRNDQIGSLTENTTTDLIWCGISNRKINPAGGFFSDMRITKADASGNLQWDFAIGENDNFSQTGRDVVTLANDEGFVVVGSTNQNGTEDILLVKTTLNGQVQWQQIIGGPAGQVGGDGNQKGQSVKQTEDGGFIITGTTTQGTNEDVYLVKTNAEGVVQWQKRYGSLDRNDSGQMVIQSSADQGYLIIAKIRFENNDVIGIIKTDSEGNLF
jgi:hypothetical protein